ncbi:MAG: O-antigen ligase family protein [Chloroflexi bacterium]|nr:O-antigen ligase family protein [Chloroflexota bacterium]
MTAITARSRASRRTRRSAPTVGEMARFTDLRAWLGHGIEAAWLIAAVITPLIVLSEETFLSKTELPKVATVRIAAGAVLILLLVDAGLIVWRQGFAIPRRMDRGLISRVSRIFRISGVRGDARVLVMASVVVVIGTIAAATVFALVPRLSAWGSDPGGESYSLYSTASYGVLFFAVATRLRTRSQVWRLMAAIVSAGTLAALVGIAQHFGLEPFGIRSTSGTARVSGTAGNPIFFATILAVTFTLAAGASLSVRELAGRRFFGRAAGWLSVYGLVAFVHITALLITLSRGPWLGVAAAMFAIGVLAPVLFGWRRAAATGLLTVVAVLASLAFLGMTDGWANPTRSSSAVAADGPGATGVAIVNETQDRITTLTGVFDSDANPRLVRWDGALDLAVNRPAPPVGVERGTLIRSLFGYGPDTFPDVFPLVAPRSLTDVRTPAAHNDPLNRLVETGLAGLLAWMALWLSLAFLLLGNLWRNRKVGGAGQAVTLAVGAALVAWFVAGLTGIPKSGDSVLFWLLAGLAVATARVFRGEENGRSASETSGPAMSGAIRAAAVFIVALVAITVTWITWTETVQRVRADASAAAAASPDPGGSTAAERLDDIDQAISLAPDVPRFHTIRSGLYEQLALEPGTADPVAALREAATSAERALALNPLDRDLNFRAAYLDWELAGTGDLEAALRTHAIYERLALLTPQHWRVGPRLAAVEEALGFDP